MNSPFFFAGESPVRCFFRSSPTWPCSTWVETYPSTVPPVAAPCRSTSFVRPNSSCRSWKVERWPWRWPRSSLRKMWPVPWWSCLEVREKWRIFLAKFVWTLRMVCLVCESFWWLNGLITFLFAFQLHWDKGWSRLRSLQKETSFVLSPTNEIILLCCPCLCIAYLRLAWAILKGRDYIISILNLWKFSE